jgi:hypothetical protein
MNELNNGRWRRHQLVTAAHDFILDVLPFRYPHSCCALTRFLDVAAHAGTSISETDAVLVDVLAVLNTHVHCVNLLDLLIRSVRQAIGSPQVQIDGTIREPRSGGGGTRIQREHTEATTGT